MIPMSYPPTPIQELRDPAAQATGNRVFMKRDDLLPFSFGGNKVRIAEEFLADMRKRDCTGLVMYGDRRSNLCRALAMRCAQEEVPCVMVATQEHAEQGPEPFNALIINHYQVPVVSCDKAQIAPAVDHAMDLLRARGLAPYYIYGSRLGTGNEGVAARAYAHAYQEICRQEAELGQRFDLIVTPYGTGSTQGGLVAGSLQAGDGRAIVGISISSRTAQRARAVLRATVCDYFAKQGLPEPAGVDDALHLECGYNCGGYGLFSPEVEQAIARVLASDGLPLDPTYTGKAYCGMLSYLASHQIRGKRVLFLHTGGLPLFFDYLGK